MFNSHEKGGSKTETSSRCLYLLAGYYNANIVTIEATSKGYSSIFKMGLYQVNSKYTVLARGDVDQVRETGQKVLDGPHYFLVAVVVYF